MIRLKFISICLMIVLLTSCNNSKTNQKENKIMTTQKETYVLVHSAWLGGWQWENVAKTLKENGHTVLTPDLPGHGNDKTPPADITMEDYVNTITNILDNQDQPVILVGHSFNGITVSRAAELRPDKVKSLVYLTAFLLPNGGSFFGAVQGVEGSKAVENFYLSEDKTYALIKQEEIQNAFAHDIPKEAFDGAKPYIVPEPAAPLRYELQITEKNFGKISKYYIECTEDRAIPIEIQRAMYQGKVLKVYTINSSHTPNFSQPHKVAEALLDVSTENKKMSLVNTNSDKNVKFHRLFSNDNQIFTHFETQKNGKSYAHMTLLETGEDSKTLEAVQEVPENQVGGKNTMFNGVKVMSEAPNDLENKALIEKFLNDVWIGGNMDIIQDFFHDGKVIQHNPMVENDVSGLFSFMQNIQKQGISLQYQKVLATFTAGDFVMTYSEGLLGGNEHIFADLFRLENGKIIEHWDVIQEK